MDDKRIGRIANDNVEFPSVSVSGSDYIRPASTRNIGGGYFVALDQFSPADFDLETTITELQQKIAPKKQKPVKEDVSSDGAEPVSSSL